MAADKVGGGASVRGNGIAELNGNHIGTEIGSFSYRKPHRWPANHWTPDIPQQKRRGAHVGTVEEMAGDRVAGVNGVDEINGIKGGSNRWSAANRWKPNGVPPKGRLLGSSNGGGSFSDAGSEEEYEDDEEHEGDYAGEDDAEAPLKEELSEELDGDYREETEVPSKEISDDDGDDGGEKVVEASEEDEDNLVDDGNDLEANDDEDDNLIDPSTMDRGASNHSLGFDEDDMMEDDRFDIEQPMIPDVPSVKSRGRERLREVVPEEVRDLSDDSNGANASFPVSRGVEDRGQSSVLEIYREMAGVRQKAARGMIDTTKRKAETTRNGEEPKPKKGKAPAAPRRKSSAGESKDRIRLSTDVRARVTLERAREILATVKAAMLKDSPQALSRRMESRTVNNFSSSEDERVPFPVPPPRVTQQPKIEENVVKKRSRPSKGGDKEAARRRQPKLVAEVRTTEEKVLHQRPRATGPGHESVYKSAHFSATSGDSFGDAKGANGREVAYGQQVAVAEKKVRKRKKKDALQGPLATGLCPGSVLRDENWTPPASPFGLIQESLYKDPWKVLLSCMLLNKTAGRQMHKVIWDLFKLCPDAETAINMDTAKIAEKVYSLGLQNKRAKMIQRFSYEYLHGEWTNVSQLHGIGKYAADAYAIFCQGLWREVQPDDLNLIKYWNWLQDTDGMGTAFTSENS